ncbi:MAG: hypothetical protein R3303_06495, partial [Marinobacter sp.]|nr:hypothetical protein [Marinobacter sp.]
MQSQSQSQQRVNTSDAADDLSGRAPYTWRSIAALALNHRPRLVRANALAVLATLVSVPVPLLLPVLV